MNNREKNKPAASDCRRKMRNDIAFIAAILLIVLIAILAMLFFRTSGDSVIVTVDGQRFGEYPLNKDREVEIRYGNSYNILVIRNGTAYVELASCPDGICSSHRPISYDGESIICLPNKVVVEVFAQKRKAPDIIV